MPQYFCAKHLWLKQKLISLCKLITIIIKSQSERILIIAATYALEPTDLGEIFQGLWEILLDRSLSYFSRKIWQWSV